jgi:Cu2+-exporting ATPase
MVIETYDIILVRNNPLNIVAIVKLSHATLRKMIPKLLWATGGNTFVIPLATSALYAWGVLLTPATGMTIMATSAVVVAIDMSFLNIKQYNKSKD